jgi:hypothetical protein
MNPRFHPAAFCGISNTLLACRNSVFWRFRIKTTGAPYLSNAYFGVCMRIDPPRAFTRHFLFILQEP